MPSLFHYTTNEGAIKIIESACLHATHFRCLNDARELQLARDIVVPLYEQEIREEIYKLINEGKINTDFIKDHGAQIFEVEATTLFNTSISVTDLATPIFITSFCHHEDERTVRDGLLSQWRGYGALGGCAVEFDEKKLEELVRHERDQYAFTHVSLSKVLYDSHVDAFNMDELKGTAAAIVRYMVEQTPESEEAYRRLAHGMYKAVALNAPRLKSVGFQEEHEVRIVAPCMRTEAAAEFSGRKRRDILLRFKSGTPIPYVKLFEGIAALPITRILVGPQRDQDRVVYALQLTLEAKGMIAEVAKSGISYLPG
jgi:hypothetical protein